MACPICGHPGVHRVNECLRQSVQERDEARAVAQEFYADLRSEVSDYIWEKHYRVETERFPWLKLVGEAVECSGSDSFSAS